MYELGRNIPRKENAVIPLPCEPLANNWDENYLWKRMLRFLSNLGLLLTFTINASFNVLFCIYPV